MPVLFLFRKNYLISYWYKSVTSSNLELCRTAMLSRDLRSYVCDEFLLSINASFKRLTQISNGS